MLYQLYETQRSLMEPFADFAQAAAKLYSNPLSPFGQNQLSQRISASYDLLHRLGKDYEKPAFGISTVNVDGVDVAINERIEVNKPFCELRRFKRFSDDIKTLAKLKAEGMQVLAPSPQLKADLTQVGDAMLKEWLDKAGPDGKALVDAYRK